jgi:hypothetical protein
MTEHLITPPPQLVEQWRQEHTTNYDLARQAARWGADQELEECCKLFEFNSVCGTKFQRRSSVRDLRDKRRPKQKQVSMTISIVGTQEELEQLIRKLKHEQQVSIQL